VFDSFSSLLTNTIVYTFRELGEKVTLSAYVKIAFMTRSRLLFIAAIIFVIAAIVSFIAAMAVNRAFLAIAVMDMLIATVLMVASRRQRT